MAAVPTPTPAYRLSNSRILRYFGLGILIRLVDLGDLYSFTYLIFMVAFWIARFVPTKIYMPPIGERLTWKSMGRLCNCRGHSSGSGYFDTLACFTENSHQLEGLIYEDVMSSPQSRA